MGRTPQPAHLKLLNGRGPGRDSGGRKVAAPPGFRRLEPAKPEWLSPEASAEWDRVLPELLRVGVLKEIDGGPLAAYCEAWSMFHEAREILKREGATYRGPNGMLRAHPAVAIARGASAEFRAWAAHFGLTPAAEQRIRAVEADLHDDDNPF